MSLNELDLERLAALSSKWGLELSGTLEREFPNDWEAAMGLVLGAVVEHVMSTGVSGHVVERLRFAEAFNGDEDQGRAWVLRYVDPDRVN